MITYETTSRPVLTRETLLADLEGLGELPSLSPIVTQLTMALSRPDVEVTEIEDIIHRDPVIAARVIMAANTAAFASYTPTTSVRGALLRLGLNRVRRLALLISLYNVIPVRRKLQETFWRHSLAVAYAAETILRRSSGGRRDEEPDLAFLAGLMHDLGILVLTHHYPRHYAPVNTLVSEHGGELWETETQFLGLDHGDVGACLAEHWRFPAEVCAAVRYHHRFDQAPTEYRGYAAVVRVADALCGIQSDWNLGEASVLTLDDPAVEGLQITAQELETVADEVRADYDRVAATLSALD